MLVDIDRLLQLGDELREAVPTGVQEAKEVIRQKESIINQAYLEAQRVKESAEQESVAIKSAAHQEHDTRVDDAEVVKAAEA